MATVYSCFLFDKSDNRAFVKIEYISIYLDENLSAKTNSVTKIPHLLNPKVLEFMNIFILLDALNIKF